ncbi:hypothetical protein [Nannocystis punicea]|uniref:Uncharacterized protein n=1 Tax=Nannocystis punicea TaxID=2995304 RepID=A0ABY7HFQ0_9BACT|nr:hypothetical protein [Nannocystis poenicansa]WAS98122.1 hypothetical protein O0S08_18440 [Nannocystis poenicansa]
MEFARLAEALGGETLAVEQGGRSELAPFVLRSGTGPEVQVYPELEEGACVGAVFAVARADAAETPRIVLRAEGALERGAKAVGLSRELQLGDPAFDAAVYVESEAPEALVARVLADPAARAAAAALVRGPAGEVQLGEGRVTARLSAAQLEQPAAAHELVASLRALAAAMAVPKDMPTRGELVRRRAVGHIFGIAFAWLLTLGLAVLLRPPQVLAWGPVFGALGLGGLLWLLVCAPLGLVLRGAPDSLRWFALAAGAFLLTTPFAGMKLALWANAALDKGPEVAVRLPVTLVDRSETLVLIDVVGLESGRTSTRLAVPMDRVFGTLPKAPGSLILTTGEGALGWPWLVDVRP